MTKSDETVYRALERHAGPDDIAMPTIGELVAATGLSPNTIRAALRSLIDAGHVEIIHDGGGRGNPTYYGLHNFSTTPPALTIVPENPSKTLQENPSKTLQKTLQNTSNGAHDPRVSQTPLGGLTNSGLGSVPVSETPETVQNPGTGTRWQDDGYLTCECGKPRIADDDPCPWCHRGLSDELAKRLAAIAERHAADWHPSQGPREISPAVAANLERMRAELHRASIKNRFRRWDKRP